MRPDGTRVKDLPPLVAAIPYIMPKRYDAWNSVTENIDEEVIKGSSRSREVVNARQAAMYLVRRMTNLSTPDIGREFGKRDHTTVLHSLEQIEKKMKSDPVFNQTIKEITININSKR